jgi:osmoprotectant transport system substrate-binding protein
MRGLVLALITGAALAGCGSSATSTVTSTETTTVTTTSTTTTTVSSSIDSAALPGTGRPAVVIGDKNFTEQFILGELYDLALAAEGFDVSLTQNIGPTSVSLQAMQDGTLGVYPEYLNTWDSEVAGYKQSFPTLARAFGAAQTWATSHGYVLLTPTPFSDTPGLGVTTNFALQNGLRTLAGLRRIAATLTLGVPLEFKTSPTGLPLIEQTYGFTPASVRSVLIGDQYSALNDGTVQAAYVTTTDAQLSDPSFTLLADPRYTFGFGNAVPVLTGKVYAEEGPAFANTIDEVDALLTTSVMRQLNAEVDLDHEVPQTVASQFLAENGLMSNGG